MNKILLDKEKIVNLNISKDSVLNIDKEKIIEELNIVIKENVELVINHYSEINSNNLRINVIQDNRSIFKYNHSYKCFNEYNLNININMNGNKSKNYINIHGLSDGGISKVIVDGKVINNTLDNELYENIKLMNLNDGSSYIYPNMYINTKNVIANHAATITDISHDYLFYLNTKGISNEDAKKIIIDGFLENVARNIN